VCFPPTDHSSLGRLGDGRSALQSHGPGVRGRSVERRVAERLFSGQGEGKHPPLPPCSGLLLLCSPVLLQARTPVAEHLSKSVTLDSLVRRAEPALLKAAGGGGRGAQEAAGGRGAPSGRFPASPGARDAAALPLDVPMEVVGAREALVAVLALVRPDARVDAQVVLQVVVVDELGVAVEADVGPLARVLPHVDLQLVLSGKRTKPHVFTRCVNMKERGTRTLQYCFSLRF